MIEKPVVRMGLWNLALGATVFLPVFLVGNMIVGALRGLAVLDQGVAHQASALSVFYVFLLGPIALGVMAHSAAIALALKALSVRKVRIAILLLAPLVPLVPVALGFKASRVFVVFYHAAAIATVAYGVAATALLSRKELLGSSRPATVED